MPVVTDFRLSAVEFEIVWADLGLGDLPYPLWMPSNGRDQSERARIRAGVWQALAERGLAAGGRPDPDLADAMAALARPALAVDLVGHTDRVLRAVAVSGRGPSVLAVLDGADVALVGLGTAALARSIVRVLPPANPGPGHSLSVPLDTLARVGANGADDGFDDDFGADPFGADVDASEAQALTRLGVPAADAVYLTELAAGRRAGGQFGVSAGRVRSAVVISWFDTPAGRYLMVGDNGWLSIAPADSERIGQRIDAAIAALTRRQ